ncbi:type IV pilus assembly protein PilQ [Candidatus Gastranaerophilus sp. (ex Termes propinquus)]|nr:type IV pilus assembly protein PilQ [Candidatus Gastranaerophilus sp. (ex Termes propinquus)]
MFGQESKKKLYQKATACLCMLAFSLPQVSLAYSSYNDRPILNVNSITQEDVQPISLDLTGSTTITNSTDKINLSLRDSDVRQVLRMFADRANLNIIFHDSVNGKVTLDLVNTTLNDAFMLVINSLELSYYVEAGTLIVSERGKAKNMGFAKQNMTTIPVKYVDASTMATFLNQNIFYNVAGLSNEEIVTFNPRRNEVMIFGTKNDVNMAKRVIDKLDTKPMVNTFKVNHTTPKEMAAMLCDSIIQTTDYTTMGGSSSGGSGGGESSGAGSGGGSNQGGADEIILGGGYVACRAVTGGSGGSGAAIRSGSSGQDAKLASFGVAPLTVAYFQNHGYLNVYGGSVEQLNVIREFIEQNDKKQPMAYIEMSIIELNERGMKEFDNEWRMWTPFFSLNFNAGEGLSTNPLYPTFVTKGPFKGESWTLVDDQGEPLYTYKKYDGPKTLAYTLKYLVENGKGRTLSNPKIIVTNGQKSTIDMTSDYVKSVKTEAEASGLQTIISKTYEIGSDEGLKIDVVPFISPDGYVSLNITPNLSKVKEKTNDYTLLSRRDLELKNIRIKDGETLILGGYIVEEESQNTIKMPVLGDLPVIGVFFRSSRNEKTKNELIIMITPHIVYDTDDISRIRGTNL